MARDEGIDLSMLREKLLKEEGRLPSDKEPIMATVKGVISSEIWKRMKRAEKILVEVPFSTTEKDGGKPEVVSGAMDLVFKEKDGWVIADYKTDISFGIPKLYLNQHPHLRAATKSEARNPKYETNSNMTNLEILNECLRLNYRQNTRSRRIKQKLRLRLARGQSQEFTDGSMVANLLIEQFRIAGSDGETLPSESCSGKYHWRQSAVLPNLSLRH